MKVGIMQPYFIPYIGYWQLIAAVDRYVIYDDVNYIKGGWINRNRILLDGKPKYFNVQLTGASPNKKINEISVNNNLFVKRKALRLIEAAYKKAPFYEEVFPLIRDIIQCEERNLAIYIGNSLKNICEYLEIATEILYSSSLEKDCSLRGEEKVLAICKIFEATEYYNAFGGQKLYSYLKFLNNGIILKFLKTNEIMYQQFSNEFQRNLSIVDVLMFNSKEKVQKMLQEYSIILGVDKNEYL